MKKLISLILAVTVFFTLTSCLTKKKDAKDIKIGIVAPQATHGWVAGVAYYAEKYCKDNNLSYNTITTRDAAEMQSGLTDLIAWGADVIVTYPQWTGMETAFQEVVDQGIPVVNFDIDVDVDGLHFVTGDNYDMGYQSAKHICEKVESGATIAVMDVPASGSVAGLRKEGFYAYLKKVGFDTSNIFEVQSDTFSRETGLSDMADILEAHKTIDAVFSMDDEHSIGIIQAIKEAGRTDIKAISGGGGCQEYFNMIADEQYSDLGLFSATYSPSMIQDAIKLAIDIKKGKECEKKIIIPTTIVNSSNVQDYLDPSNTIY